MRRFLAVLLAGLLALSACALAEEIPIGEALTDEVRYALEILSIERGGNGLEAVLLLQNLDIEPMRIEEAGFDFRLTYGEEMFELESAPTGDLQPLEEYALVLSYAVPEIAFSGDFGIFLLTIDTPDGKTHAVDVLAALGLAVEGAPPAALNGYTPFGDGQLSAKFEGFAVDSVEGRDSLKRLTATFSLRNDGAEAFDSALGAELSFRERYRFEPLEAPAIGELAPGAALEARFVFEVANAVATAAEPLTFRLTIGNSSAEFSFVPAQADTAPLLTASAMVEAGYRHSFALSEDGTLWAWGSGEYGRLGTGSASSSYSAEAVALEDVVAASAGYYHSLFLTADGGVWAAGCNYDYGQIGDGSGANRLMPVRVLENARQVLAGADYSAAVLNDGTLWMWGRNDVGQLGLGDSESRATPAQVPLEGVSKVVGGEKFLLALLEDGRVFGWGDNPYGQLGDGGGSLVPRDIALSGVTDIAAGNNHAMALTAAGALRVWGDDAYGQLGGGSFAPEQPIVAIEAGGDMSAARLEDGSWWVWGDLFGGEPGALKAPAAEQLSLGYWHALAAEKGGVLWGFGSDDYGQIGQYEGSYQDTYRNWSRLTLDLHANERPSQKPKDRDKAASSEPFASAIAPVAAGYYTSYAVDGAGNVWAWGRSDYGQIGAGEGEKFESPTKIEGLKGVVQIAAGDYHALFVTEGGDLYGAGCSEDYNQLGNGTYENANEPVFIMGGVARAWAGRDISAALLEDGTLLTWGANGAGELGLGHTDKVEAPTEVALEGIVDLAVGKGFMAALLEDGTVFTWGSDAYGQLGLGGAFEVGVPKRVELSDVVSIAAGSAHMAALDADGNVWTWGAAAAGQMGSGDFSNQPSPIRVSAVEDCAAIFAGGDSTGARLRNGAVLLWGGADFYSTPGHEEIRYYDSQRSESTTAQIAEISMGSFHLLAVDSEGNVYALGDNSYGQLGTGGSGYGGYSSYYRRWEVVGLNLEDAAYEKPQSTPRPDSDKQAL